MAVIHINAEQFPAEDPVQAAIRASMAATIRQRTAHLEKAVRQAEMARDALASDVLVLAHDPALISKARAVLAMSADQ